MKNGMAMYEISIKNLLNYVCCITVFLSMKFADLDPIGDIRPGIFINKKLKVI